MAKVPRVAIIGGGFGGLRVAQTLASDAVEITLIDRSNHHLFQPLLYQVAMAGVSPADIAIPIRAVLRTQKNCKVLLGEVTGVDLDARELVIDDGHDRLGYDFLVVAAGAKTNWFGNDEWPSHAFGLKTLDDAIEIRRCVLLAFEAAEREQDPAVRDRLLTFVVIGGGPTGVEIAGGLAEVAHTVLSTDFRHIHDAKTRIVLVEATDKLLPGMDEDLARKAKESLATLGVEVQLGQRVQVIDHTGVLIGDERIDCPTVLWTAGVRARSLADKLGAKQDRGGRVIVEQDCSIPGHDNAFVIGDMACFVPEGAERPLPGIAPVAIQQGTHVAKSIRRFLYEQPSFPFKYLDKGMMATIGRSRAVVQTDLAGARVRMSGGMAWLAWLFIHIMYLVGFRNRVMVLFQWGWSYFTYKRGARLITGGASWRRLHELTERAESAE